MKRTINFLIFTIITLSCFAQQLEIVSPLSHAGSVGAASVPTDNNGNPCAKIIVEASIDGIEIEGSYIVGDAVKTTGKYELFVAIPKKQGRKITLLHDKYGSLDIPLWTDDGALIGREAYRVKLKPIQEEKVIVDMHGNKVDVENKKVEVIVHDDAGGQYLVMKVSPADASVEIDGQSVTVKDGALQKFLSYGKHTYKAEHSMYESKSGTFEIGESKVNVSVDLTPIFGFLKITTAPESGADIFLNGRKIGKSPFSTESLVEGDYTLKVVKEMYDSEEKSVTVVRNKTTDVAISMQPAFGNVTISTQDANATLSLDGRDLGKGSWTGRVERGKHIIEAKRANHRSTIKTIDIAANTQPKIEMEAPTPIVGSLNISSDPIGARIKVDGKDMGETPNIISGLLIGSHTVSLSKQGCGDYEKTITIEEGKITPLDATMEKGKEITISTGKPGDEIYIDGKLVGTSPFTTSLSFGSHQVYAMRGSEKTAVEKVNVTTSISNTMALSFGLGKINGHEWVDLGLPSGLKWATCNVGANSPEEYGSYFAWGETKTKKSYDTDNCETSDKDITWLYNNGYLNSKGDLTKAHDAANANWGSTWRMPTQAEILELLKYTSKEWVNRNGVYGILRRSIFNGNSIFIPDAGKRNGETCDAGYGHAYCWSSTPDRERNYNAFCIYFQSNMGAQHMDSRYIGRSIRPVSE